MLFWVTTIVGILFGADYLPYFLTGGTVLHGVFIFQIFILFSVPLLAIAYRMWSLVQFKKSGLVTLRSRLWWIWGINIALIFVWVAFVSKDFKNSESFINTTPLDFKNDLINIDLIGHKGNDNFLIKTDVLTMHNGSALDELVYFNFQASDSTSNLVEEYYSFGPSRESARRKAENINLNLNHAQGEISIQNYFVLNQKDKFRGQRAKLTFNIPVGKKVKFENLVPAKLARAVNLNCNSRIFTMTSDGLVCLQEG